MIHEHLKKTVIIPGKFVLKGKDESNDITVEYEGYNSHFDDFSLIFSGDDQIFEFNYSRQDLLDLAQFFTELAGQNSEEHLHPF